ncbi:hypothetical protein TNCV_4118811 [Trichonephila clavipes]|nr:hypothetical protein TNCV_4118811 [Trichonephila clavipes]
MFDSSSYDNPTPLARADASRDVLPRGVNEDEAANLFSRRRRGTLLAEIWSNFNLEQLFQLTSKKSLEAVAMATE